ncbi:MAG: aldo/keto reductase, partial [Actinomycetia bacterium]|nr:aldo/keto reductase [Actinomycetes bacterium]
DTDYLDLLLIHGPKPWPPQPGDADKTYFAENLDVWRAMTDAYRAGTLAAIGVSNFEIPDVQNLLDHADVPPMVNQIEFRVGYTEDALTAFCQAHGILVEAYSPLGTGALVDHPDIAAVAARCGVSVPQLCIRYALQRGTLPLPKAVHPEYIRANTEVDFEIPAADMAALDALVIDLP